MVAYSNWGHYGVDAVAACPTYEERVYCAMGMYTNSWDPKNGAIYRSTDRGNTWAATQLPFKCGGNMTGRGMGERLAVDPNNPNVLYFGARAGKGLWRSIDGAVTWSQATQFPNVGNYVPTDSNNIEKQVMGIAFVTFDPNSGNPNGSARIFVGVADVNQSISCDEQWSCKLGARGRTAIELWTSTVRSGSPSHKGRFAIKENCLYVTYSTGVGPDDGTKGAVWRYHVAGNSWSNITPRAIPYPGMISHGYGGLAVDQQTPGTIMVAALNNWKADALIWRSINSGVDWTPSFTWDGNNSSPVRRVWKIRNDNAPWIATESNADVSNLPSGWWIESLEIDPKNSDHVVYGTGMTVYATNNMTAWDRKETVRLDIMSKGIEETSVKAITCPPGSRLLYSAIGDVTGFRHDQFDSPPQQRLPLLGTSTSVDYAGNSPQILVRTGQEGKGGSNLIISKDNGASWYAQKGATSWWTNGQAVITASGNTIVWSTSNGGVQISVNEGSWRKISELSQGSGLAADKVNNALVWAWNGTVLYRSTDTGATWKSAYTFKQAIKRAVPAPNKYSGDLWVSTGDGLYHTTDSGNTFVKIGATSPNVAPTAGWYFALGAPDSTNADSIRYGFTVYGFFQVGGVNDMYFSVDAGANPFNAKWYRMSGGGAWGDFSSNRVAASMDNVGQVFIGTNGRGLWRCENALQWKS